MKTTGRHSIPVAACACFRSSRCTEMAKLIEKRPSLSNNISRVTPGTGKVSKYNKMERVDPDYDGFIKTRTRPQLLIACTKQPVVYESTVNRHVPNWASLAKENEMAPPKTYLTKTDSVLLHSDRKVILDTNSQGLKSETKGRLDVKGRSIKRPNTRASSEKWMHLVGRKKDRLTSAWSINGSSCRERERYIKSRASSRTHTSEPTPYSWNYAVAPTKLIDTTDESDMDTVKDLSEAVLAFRKENIESDTDKYLKLIRNKWKDRTEVEKQQLILGGRICKVNDWTRDWINVHRNYLRDSKKQEGNGTDLVVESEPKPKPKPVMKKPKRVTTFTWDGGYDKYSRVPVNTPMTYTHRTITRSSKRVKTRDTV